MLCALLLPFPQESALAAIHLPRCGLACTSLFSPSRTPPHALLLVFGALENVPSLRWDSVSWMEVCLKVALRFDRPVQHKFPLVQFSRPEQLLDLVGSLLCYVTCDCIVRALYFTEGWVSPDLCGGKGDVSDCTKCLAGTHLLSLKDFSRVATSGSQSHLAWCMDVIHPRPFYCLCPVRRCCRQAG